MQLWSAISNSIGRFFEKPVAAHHFIDACALTNDSDQGAIVLSLLQAELDSFDGIRQIDGTVLALVYFDQGDEHVERSPSSVPRSAPQSSSIRRSASV